MEPWTAKKIELLWTHLHWLIVLAQQGSYTAAAARLGVSKAAMSQRIAELERAAGVPLVRRTTRSVRLTEAGQRLVDDTRAPFERIAHSFAGVRDLAGVPRGLLRVTAPVALARQQLVPRLADFLRANPEVRLELELSDRLSSLAMEGFDLAIRHAASVPDTHVAWLLCPTRSVLVASRAYLRRRGAPEAAARTWRRTTACTTRARRTRPPGPSSPRPAGAASERVTVPVAGPVRRQQQRGAARRGAGRARASRWCRTSARRPRCRPASWSRCCRSGGRSAPSPSSSMPSAPTASHVPRAVTAFVAWLREAFAAGFAA